MRINQWKVILFYIYYIDILLEDNDKLTYACKRIKTWIIVTIKYFIQEKLYAKLIKAKVQGVSI